MRLVAYWCTGHEVEIRPGVWAEVTAATWVQDVGHWASHSDHPDGADRIVSGPDWLLAVCWAPSRVPSERDRAPIGANEYQTKG